MAGDDGLKHPESRSEENRTKDIIRELIERSESGEEVVPEEYLTRYPEFENELRRWFELLRTNQIETIRRLAEIDGGSKPDSSLQIIGDFKILREIGRGGMGTVYEAEQISLNRKVALKLLPPHLSLLERDVQKFRREAEAGGRQSHPGIIAVHVVGEHDGVHYIAQELVEGGFTLAGKLDELKKTKEQPPGYFREVARLIAAVADALQHAHDHGVIHRDIKPSNILLTGEGQPKVTDFGLARVEDALELSRTGDFAGTPYYMSPEQAMSRRIGIDRRTDVYSLGVTLYEMLTLERPFDGETSQEVLKKVLLLDPVVPYKINPRTPRDLSTICLKAMEKPVERRYQSMRELADDLRRFLSGEAILAKPPGLSTKLWKLVKRNPVASVAVGVAIWAVLCSVGYLLFIAYPQMKHDRDTAVAAVKESEKQKNIAIVAQQYAEKQAEIAEDQRAITDRLARIAQQRYHEITRLFDMKRLSDLEKTVDELWPAFPGMVKTFESWLDRARDLVSRLDEHRTVLLVWQTQAEYDDLEDQLRFGMLMDLVEGIERFMDGEAGALKIVEERLAFAKTVVERSTGGPQRKTWEQAIAAIADRKQSPLYSGLEIKSIIGLVPIGQDPHSGLWEFAHVQTGAIPRRGEDGKLILTEEMGLVFVLIPGGCFNMGAVSPSKDKPSGSSNVDPHADSDEGPVHLVSIKPFLISKFEMTQGQWLRFTGHNPSTCAPGRCYGGDKITFRNPVESVSWSDCHTVVWRLNLRLPSEAEWEYACRAGTTSVWWAGNTKEMLQDKVNLADRYCKSHGGPPEWSYADWLDDGHAVHAPVGSFEPNPFGLHNVHGNVREWCQDSYQDSYKDAPVDGSAWQCTGEVKRVFRGGGWRSIEIYCRSTYRENDTPELRYDNLGFRPALSLSR